jgi:hypothetical protein
VPRPCSVCHHPAREAIDRAIVGGESAPRIAAQHRVSDDAIRRHRAGHLPVVLREARQREEEARDTAIRDLAEEQRQQEAAHGDDLLGQVRQLHERTLLLLERAEAADDVRPALGAIREARGNLELLAKLIGELDDRPQVNILIAAVVEVVKTYVPSLETRRAIATDLGALLGRSTPGATG